MKKIVFIFLIAICLSNSLKGQTSLFDSVYLQFTSEYLKNLKEGSNYFTAINSASKLTFRLSNKSYVALLGSSLNQKKKNINEISGNLFDTLIQTFLQKDLWIDNPSAKEKYKEFFDYSYTRICDCISPTLIKNAKEKSNKSPLDSCMRILNANPSYNQKMKELAAKYPQAEILEMGKYYSRYLFENCEAFRNEILYLAKGSSALLYESDLYYLKSRILDTVVKSYSTNKTTELKYFFPDFKKFETSLKSASGKLANTNYMSLHNETPRVEAESKTVTKTFFYYKDNKAFLYCRIIYMVDIKNGLATMKSIQYIPSEKIPNRKELLKDLNTDTEEIINIGPVKQ